MSSANFLTKSLPFLILAAPLLVHSDTFDVQKCYCVSPTSLAQITTYNWTDTTPTSHTWDVHSTVTRNDDIRRSVSGIQCTSPHPAQHDCWDIPYVPCYKELTAKAGPPQNYRYNCADVEGKHICANLAYLEVDRQKTILPGRKRSHKRQRVLDCGDVCEATWPGQGLRNACSHRNTNPKSKHFGEDVPSGHYWQGKDLKPDTPWQLGSPKGACYQWKIDFERH